MLHSNRLLIVAITVYCVVIIGAIIYIQTSVEGDPAAAFTILGGAATLGMTSLLSLKASTDNTSKLDVVHRAQNRQSAELAVNTNKTIAIEKTTEDTHLAVNSRMDQLIETVKQLAETQKRLASAQAHAAGVEEGRAQQIPSEYHPEPEDPPPA